MEIIYFILFVNGSNSGKDKIEIHKGQNASAEIKRKYQKIFGADAKISHDPSDSIVWIDCEE